MSQYNRYRDSDEPNFNELANRHKENKVRGETSYKNGSKKRLIANITKKLKTTMIGSLACFEEEFGELWGHNKDYDDKTDDERDWYDAWQATRTKILHSGNNQLRAATEEINQYSMTWDRHHIDFIIKKD